MKKIFLILFLILLCSQAQAQTIEFLASADSATNSAKAILGRSYSSGGNVTLIFTNLKPYLIGSGTVHVVAEQIVDNGLNALTSLPVTINADYPVSANSITITIPDFFNAAGYIVTLTPGTGGSPPAPISTTETVTINMALDGGPVTYKASGFLHTGFLATTPSDAFVTTVKPKLIRCGQVSYSGIPDICADLYARAVSLGAKVQVIVSDQIYSSPWPGDGGNWSTWDNRCTTKANAAVTAGRTYQWDIWNEPNYPVFWDSAGGQTQWFEAWRRCVNIIRGIIPGAVIVGPSIGPYDQTYLQQFLTYAKANNVLPNILSWHSFDTGTNRAAQIPINVAAMRNYMTANAMNVGQIQINEVVLNDEFWQAGPAIRYLANIERTEVVNAAHACWGDTGTNTGDNCFNSPGTLNGLLTTNASAARSSWWAYKGYGDLTGRLVGFTGIIPAATIARTGSCAAAGTSCNLSSVTAGDLVVTFAYRSGNATAPSAAANNTSIRTGSTSGGQNTASYRLSCRRASSSGDTSSGTFANATGVVSIAYQGTNINSTADCQTSGIGARGATGNGVNWAKTSTTVSYQSLALTKIDNTAWVVGFMGGNASAVCTPASLTTRSSAGVVRVSDSNATVTGFSTGTCGVSSETWMSETLEILPMPAPPAGDSESPSVPAGLTLAVISSAQINASWSPSTDNVGVTEYRVERCAGAGCSNFIEVENPTPTSYNDIGLLASTSYSYRVRASDLVGNLSGYSTTQTAATQAPSSGGGGALARAIPYAEAICNSDSNVFFCEDFEGQDIIPIPNNCQSNWTNPGILTKDICFPNGGSHQHSTIALAGFNQATNKVWRCSKGIGFVDIDTGVNTGTGNCAVAGWLKPEILGTGAREWYVRFQIYFHTDHTWPADYDYKMPAWALPRVFVDPPSAEYEGGLYVHQDFACSLPEVGFVSFNDVPSIRYSNVFQQAPYQGEYCPPLTPGVAADGIHAPRLVTGRWYTMELHYKLGLTAGTGRMRMWLDDVLTYDFSRPTCTGTCADMGYIMILGFMNAADPRTGYAEFDNIVYSRSKIGLPGGAVVNPPSGVTVARRRQM